MPPPRIGGYTAVSLPTTFSLLKRFGSIVSSPTSSINFPHNASYNPTTLSVLLNTTTAGLDQGAVTQALVRELVKRQVEDLSAGRVEITHKEFAFKLILSTVFVLLGGVFSGLSLGLMGLDQMNLKVLATSGSPQDRSDARKVLSLLGHGRHFVLVCLLLSNVIVNETLPIFLDSITGGSGIAAVLISSALIFFAGEVLPQSVCAQHGLRIGAKCVSFVRLLMYLEAPVCWPTAKLIDWLLGSSHSHTYRRNELKTLIELHSSSSTHPDSLQPVTVHHESEGLSEVEVGVVTAALGMRDRRIEECMKRVEEVYTVNDGMKICDVDLKEILVRSQAFVPVRRATSTAWGHGETGAFVGLLTVDQLVVALSSPNDTIRTLPMIDLVQILPPTTLPDCLAYLQDHDRRTVFMISSSTIRGGDAVGFATIDDISQYLIGGSRNTSSAGSPTLVAPSRLPIARGRGGSASLGIGAFVRGIVERHRTHRASASELSFRLSSDESDSPYYHPLRTSHSHHHSNSNFQAPPIPLTRNVGQTRPVSTRPPVAIEGKGFKFPSPVLEQEDSFTLGEDETDDDTIPGGKRGEEAGLLAAEHD